ncbi:TonB-dependent receptor, partial [bacterium]|nr:TonB-dependent receptor [bacterium]
MRKITFILAGAILALAVPLFGQAPSTPLITGRVLDEKTGQPLFGANVMVKSTLLGASTDASGRFSVQVPFGRYDVEVSMMGYEKQIREDVAVLPGAAAELSFLLAPAVLLQPALIVTASKRKQAIEDAPTTVEVMDPIAIRTRNVTNLDEALQNMPGFRVIEGQIDLRGSTGFNWAAGSRVLLLVDGHPLINGDSGGINWDTLPVEEIERVEIVKGAGSALYGSNAMAGMVNIITREPSEKPETRFRISWGFWDEPAYESWRWTDRFLTWRLFERNELNFKNALCSEGFDISHSRQIGHTGILVAAGRKRSSGYLQNGDYSRYSFLAKARMRFSGNKTLMITGNWALNDHGDLIEWISQDNPMVVPPASLGDRIRYDKFSVISTFQHAAGRNLAYTLKANWYRNDWKNLFRNNRDWARTDRFGFEAQADVLAGVQSWTLGMELTGNVTEATIYGNQSTADAAVYAEDALRLGDRNTLTAGCRYDFHRVTGLSHDQQVSPRAGWVFKPVPGTSIRASAGHGFRAPSISEVFANTIVSGVRVMPNWDLKSSERAWTFELGASQIIMSRRHQAESPQSPGPGPLGRFLDRLAPSLLLDGALFWSHYKNMIDVNYNQDLNAYQFVNQGRARIRGAEAKIKATVLNGLLTGQCGMTFMDPVNLDSMKTLPYRSRRHIVTGLEIHWGRWRAGWDYRYASRADEIINVKGS